MNELPIECGDGWLGIINECHAELLKLDPNYTPTQIKEKYGMLRFYYQTTLPTNTDEYKSMYLISNKYELMSRKVCETCGETGKLRVDRPWIKTLCDEHAKP